MGLNMEEVNDWMRDNAWMALFWLIRAKPLAETSRMQVFREYVIIEIDKTNYKLACCDPFEVSKKLLHSILCAVVFGTDSEYPVSIEGYHHKFGKFPSVNDIQLYYADLEQADNKSNNPRQILYQNNIGIKLSWEFNK